MGHRSAVECLRPQCSNSCPYSRNKLDLISLDVGYYHDLHLAEEVKR